MENHSALRRRMLTGGLLLGLLAGVMFGVLQARQSAMDAALINAVRQGDNDAALVWLGKGASANAETWIGIPPTPWSTAGAVLGRLQGRQSFNAATGFRASALYLACSGPLGFRGFGSRYGMLGRASPARRPAGWPPRRQFDASPPAAGDGLLKETPLICALLEHGANPNVHPSHTAPLHLALRLHSEPVVRLLLEHGADPNTADDGRQLPLMIADAPCTELLIAHHADVNAHGYQGLTAIMAAAAEGGADTGRVRLLLEHGAEVNARDRYLQTALMHAVDVPTARLLLEHGADINAADRGGMTAVMMALANPARGRDLPQYLIRSGARVPPARTRPEPAHDRISSGDAGPLAGSKQTSRWPFGHSE